MRAGLRAALAGLRAAQLSDQPQRHRAAQLPLGVQASHAASGPTPHIGRRCSESALGATRARPARGNRDTRAAQRMLVPPRSRRASGGTQYATMQPHLNGQFRTFHLKLDMNGIDQKLRMDSMEWEWNKTDLCGSTFGHDLLSSHN
jgi:hypothetical protein